jgi:ribonuclease HII
MKYLVGVDEAGRGPLAGPVSVGVVKIVSDFDWDLVPGVGDSKKVSEKKREVIFELTKELKKKGRLDYSVSLVKASTIDQKGIVYSLNLAMKKCIERLSLDPKTCEFKLDGSLKAPAEFVQETIIRGDASEPAIGLASIMAKVTRDKYMVQIDKKYPQYEFSGHKGYGTKKHIELIKKHGKCEEHRASFLTRIL